MAASPTRAREGERGGVKAPKTRQLGPVHKAFKAGSTLISAEEPQNAHPMDPTEHLWAPRGSKPEGIRGNFREKWRSHGDNNTVRSVRGSTTR